MQAWEIIVIAWAIVATVAAMWLFLDRQRSLGLRKRFGSEYDRTVAEFPNRRAAESDLERREERLKRLRIQPLNATERDQFVADWRATQTLFVDDPGRAVERADNLIDSVMKAKGYTGYTVNERVENIFAVHPRVARRYQEACEILEEHRNSQSSTEDLRRAMASYRELFHELLGEEREEFRRVS